MYERTFTSSAEDLYLSCNLRLMNVVKVQSIYEPCPLNFFVFINIHQIYGIDFFCIKPEITLYDFRNTITRVTWQKNIFP